MPTFLVGFGPVSTPEQVGQDVLALLTDPAYDRPAYLLAPQGGLRPLDG